MNILISENLKDLRKEKNNTQEDLAEFLTVSITAVSKWERGECYDLSTENWTVFSYPMKFTNCTNLPSKLYRSVKKCQGSR